VGHPDLGVLVIWSKWGGGHKQDYTSKGDLTRLRELVRSLHETPLPVGLFIPYDLAWKAVKEFIETDGALPKSIEWIAKP
jgi:Immunity protein Imm1